MIKVVQGDRQTCQSFVEDLKSRVGQASPEIEQTVRDVIEQVRAGGDSAVKAFSEKFDGWTPENLELSREALEQAVETLSSLTEGNKLVGIISHVPALKHRIDRQIVIRKTRGGSSTIQMEG
jgi:histidinol dehydrogenase